MYCIRDCRLVYCTQYIATHSLHVILFAILVSFLMNTGPSEWPILSLVTALSKTLLFSHSHILQYLPYLDLKSQCHRQLHQVTTTVSLITHFITKLPNKSSATHPEFARAVLRSKRPNPVTSHVCPWLELYLLVKPHPVWVISSPAHTWRTYLSQATFAYTI